MKVYLIKKFETNTCGMYAWELWKIVNNYDLALREIKNDVIHNSEKLKIKYSTDPKNILIVKKVMLATRATISHENNITNSKILLIKEMESEEWPLFTYVVSEMEVITE